MRHARFPVATSPVRHVLVTLVRQNTRENNLKGVVSIASVSGVWWLEHVVDGQHREQYRRTGHAVSPGAQPQGPASSNCTPMARLLPSSSNAISFEFV